MSSQSSKNGYPLNHQTIKILSYWIANLIINFWDTTKKHKEDANLAGQNLSF